MSNDVEAVLERGRSGQITQVYPLATSYLSANPNGSCAATTMAGGIHESVSQTTCATAPSGWLPSKSMKHLKILTSKRRINIK